MEISATSVLLQLIDCIESMKNEVKKKMNAMKRAMLYQSHTKINSQEQNSIDAKKIPRVIEQTIDLSSVFLLSISRSRIEKLRSARRSLHFLNPSFSLAGHL
jgi:glycyl-tRNA synthetase (class II)